MNRKSLGMLVLLLILVLALLSVLIPDAASKRYYANFQVPLVIAHQGGDGLWPGNTLFAFEKAVEIGVDVLEMDTHITQDGQIVLMHDEEVDRTTDGTGIIENMTLAELKEDLRQMLMMQKAQNTGQEMKIRQRLMELRKDANIDIGLPEFKGWIDDQQKALRQQPVSPVPTLPNGAAPPPGQ